MRANSALNAYWVRHAPTHARTLLGWTDAPADLSDRGALLAVRRLLPERAQVFTSDLIRTIQTADHLAALPGNTDWTRCAPMASLREINLGTWQGKTSEAIPAHEQHLWQQFLTDPGDCAAPRGESWNGFAHRVETGTRAIIKKARAEHHQNVIVVSHHAVLLWHIQSTLRITPIQAFSYNVPPLAVIHTRHQAGTWHWSGFLR